MNRAVVFVGGVASLLLSDVKRTPSGELLGGHVVNGAWTLRIEEGEWRAMAGEQLVSQWPAPLNARVVDVPDDWRGNYNEIMGRAEEMLS